MSKLVNQVYLAYLKGHGRSVGNSKPPASPKGPSHGLIGDNASHRSWITEYGPQLTLLSNLAPPNIIGGWKGGWSDDYRTLIPLLIKLNSSITITTDLDVMTACLVAMTTGPRLRLPHNGQRYGHILIVT